MAEGIYIQGFDVIDTIRYIGRLNKRHQASLLSKIELLIEDEDLYREVRKAILDDFNDYTRSVVGNIFGDISF